MTDSRGDKDERTLPEAVYVWWSDMDQQWRIRKWDMQTFVEGTKYFREPVTPSAIEPTDRELALQAKIDALMLEYCPDEMTKEQINEWMLAQVAAGPEAEAALRAAVSRVSPQNQQRATGYLLDEMNAFCAGVTPLSHEPTINAEPQEPCGYLCESSGPLVK